MSELQQILVQRTWCWLEQMGCFWQAREQKHLSLWLQSMLDCGADWISAMLYTQDCNRLLHLE